MSSNSKATVYEIITDRIVAALDKGVIPWRRPWDNSSAMGATDPRNLVSGKPYNGINVLLLTLSPHASPWWLTFNQARTLGGSVRRGERGTPIFFWKVYDRKTGEPAAGDDDDDGRRRFVGRYYTVFNVEQCDGVKVPEEPKERPVKPLTAAARIVTGYRRGPTIRHGGNRAFYSPIGDVVQMPPKASFKTQQHYYGTLFHELVHSTGHSSRLNRFDAANGPAPFGSPSYSAEELVAEMGSAFLCAKARIANDDLLDNSAAYIGHWKQFIAAEPRALVTAAARGRKACELIVGAEELEESEAEAA